MRPWRPQHSNGSSKHSRTPKYAIAEERPDCKGLTFYQALGLNRKAKAAKEAEFSKLLADASEAFKKRPRPPFPWGSAPTMETEQELGMEPVEALDACDVPSQQPKSNLLDEISLEAVESLWMSFKDRAVSSRSGVRSSAVSTRLSSMRVLPPPRKVNDANIETIRRREFLTLARRLFRPSQPMVQLLEAVFDRIARRSSSSVVRTHDIATTLVLICRCEPEAKLRLLFSIFDSDDDGCVTLDEIFDMFVSVRANDFSRQGPLFEADVTFGGELSLQEAKRLFALTVPHLSIDADIIIFEDFFKAVQTCPEVLPNFLPGYFSSDWLLGYKAADVAVDQNHPRDPCSKGLRFAEQQESKTMASPSSSPCTSACGLATGPTSTNPCISAFSMSAPTKEKFVREVRNNFIGSLRRGEEHLDLSTKVGRAARIMQHHLHSESSLEPSTEKEPPHAGNPKLLPSRQRAGSNKSRASKHVSINHGDYVVPLSAGFDDIVEPIGAKEGACSESECSGVGGTDLCSADTGTKAPSASDADAEQTAESDVDDCECPPKTVQGIPVGYDVHEAAAGVALPESETRLRLSGENSKQLRAARMDATKQRTKLENGSESIPTNINYKCAICSTHHVVKAAKRDPAEFRARRKACELAHRMFLR